jgi:hypothetical protein
MNAMSFPLEPSFGATGAMMTIGLNEALGPVPVLGLVPDLVLTLGLVLVPPLVLAVVRKPALVRGLIWRRMQTAISRDAARWPEGIRTRMAIPASRAAASRETDARPPRSA